MQDPEIIVHCFVPNNFFACCCHVSGVVCCGLEEVQVLTAKDIFSILSKGIQQRKTAETLMNKNSSRSHSIFTLKIMIKECMPDGQEVMRNGQLNLVDLAGCVRVCVISNPGVSFPFAFSLIWFGRGVGGRGGGGKAREALSDFFPVGNFIARVNESFFNLSGFMPLESIL